MENEISKLKIEQEWLMHQITICEDSITLKDITDEKLIIEIRRTGREYLKRLHEIDEEINIILESK